MKAIKLTALATVLALGTTAVQAADLVTIPDVTVSGTALAITDYMFRGISQSSNNAAVQGNMMLAHASGFYANVWGSSIASAAGGAELDLLLGYSTGFDLGGVKATVDAGVMRYIYPGANRNTEGAQPDFNELYGSLSVAGFAMKGDTAKLGVALTDEYFGETGKYFYVAADYSAPIADTGVSVVSHVGFNSFDDKALEDYVDYKLGATFGVQGLTAELSYVGSDLKDSECGANLCEGRAVLTLTKAF